MVFVRCLLLLCLLAAVPGLSFARQDAVPDAPASVFTLPPSSFATSQGAPADSLAGAQARRSQSLMMPSLYVATALTQALDAHSTFTAIDAGAREGNPLIGRLAHHRPGFMVLKGAIAASAIYLGRDLAKSRKRRAIWTLVALNAGYAALVVHNYRIAAEMRRR